MLFIAKKGLATFETELHGAKATGIVIASSWMGFMGRSLFEWWQMVQPGHEISRAYGGSQEKKGAGEKKRRSSKLEGVPHWWILSYRVPLLAIRNRAGYHFDC